MNDRYNRELEALQNLGLALTSDLYDLDSLLNFLVDITGSLISARGCILRLLDENLNLLRIKAASGLGKEIVKASTQKVGEGVAGWVVQTGQPVMIDDISHDSRFSNNTKSIVSSLINVPIKIRGEVKGTLTVFDKFNPDDREATEFIEDDLRLLKLISIQAAIAIENAQLHERFEESRKGKLKDLGEKLEVIKKSPIMRRREKEITAYAGNNRPALIWAEDGSGKATIAREIHLKSDRCNHPFRIVECRGKSEEELEIELFGVKNDKPDRKGVLGEAHHGTVCLADIDCLSHALQLKLFHYLESGRYRQRENREYHYSDVKLICTVTENLDKEVREGYFSEPLRRIIAEQPLRILPLRHRKKDIPVLVEYFLQKYAPPGKEFEISPGAMGKILDHDWPGNISELETTVHHAVILARGDRVTRRHILMMRRKIREKTEVNLLRLRPVERLFKARWFPEWIALILLTALLGLSYLFFHPAPELRELSLTLSWALGWPLLFWLTLFFARIWCAVCPFRLVGHWLGKLVPQTLAVSQENLSFGVGVGSVSAAGILWVEHITDMHHNPAATFWLLSFIMAGAVLVNGLTRSHLWCREQCPLGFMCRVFSTISVAALRTNKNICASRCDTHECYKGTDQVPGCVMEIHPLSLDSNQDCILCGNCIKSCTKKSLRLSYRLHPSELWSSRHAQIWTSWLGTALIFYVILENVIVSGWGKDYPASFLQLIRNSGWAYTAAFWLAMYLAYSFVKLVSSFDFEPDKFAGNLGYCLIPLAMAGFMALYTGPFLTQWLPLMDKLLNVSMLSPGDISLYFTGKVIWTQQFFVLLGIAGSFYATHQLTLGHGWKKIVPLGSLSVISAGMTWSFFITG
ncbi:MAG: sigma 54-interacting transcriptional regulator [bacterium]